MKKNLLLILLSVCILFGGFLLFQKASFRQHTPSRPDTVRYALKHKKSNALYPLHGNPSAAYTEFYQLGGIEIHSTQNQIQIPYTGTLQKEYVIYDYENHRDIPISKSLRYDTLYYDCGKLVIISAASSSQSP